jgi:hypothetical protein
MTAEACREWRERIGALVLGQLAPDERAATVAHLEGCPACRAEAEALAPVAALLSRADPDRLGEAPAPPPRLRRRIARQIEAERGAARRRRRLRAGLGLAGATAVAATIFLGVVLVGSDDEATPPSERVAFTHLPKDVSVAATIEPHPWGTEVRVDVHGFRPGTPCRVWLRRADGSRVPAGSFRYTYAGGGEPVLSSAIDPADATAIGLRAGSKTFVAPLPPRPDRAGA